MQDNVLAMSGKAVEAAGDVNTLLLDKTGTITLGNRQAVEFIPLRQVEADEMADAAQLSSLADETPEGRSIVVLAKEKYGLRGRELHDRDAEFIAFAAHANEWGQPQRHRDPERARCHPSAGGVAGGMIPSDLQPVVEDRRDGGTPLVVAHDGRRSADPSQGFREGRHAPPLRSAPGDGHPHRDDHRRQPADRGRDRARGRGG
jgi:K+-transporting ATPase ATPase B chain